MDLAVAIISRCSMLCALTHWLCVHDRKETTLLSLYRVPDLIDVNRLLCGRVNADPGADMVQVEPPGCKVRKVASMAALSLNVSAP